jgi:hypothetical protein
MSAKDIILRPVSAQDANALVRRVHYSGKVVQNSQLHIGVFWNGRLEGALQFGPSLDKRKIQGLVKGTGWNEFIELNRMAFSPALPRNSESRAIAVSMRLLRKHAPHLKWVVTFADGAQCGDGTIYRAAGFLLTGIKKNTQVWAAPTGEKFARMSLTDGRSKQQQQQAIRISRTTVTKGKHITESGGASMRQFAEAGFKPIPGFQLRYIGFIDPSWRERLTVPVLPYSAIVDAGAGMYKGQPRERSRENAAAPPRAEGGVIPTRSLHSHAT